MRVEYFLQLLVECAILVACFVCLVAVLAVYGV